MRKAVRSLVLILALQALAVLAAAPMWIPEWQVFPWIAGGIAYVAAIFLAVRMLRTMGQAMREQVEMVRRIATTVMASMLLALWLAFAGLGTAFLAAGGLFPPVYVSRLEVPGQDQEIFLYDHSFLDAETGIFIRTGPWPWLKKVAIVPGAYWQETPEWEGDWLILGHFRYNAVSGESKW